MVRNDSTGRTAVELGVVVVGTLGSFRISFVNQVTEVIRSVVCNG